MKQMIPDIKQVILANISMKLYSYTLFHKVQQQVWG